MSMKAEIKAMLDQKLNAATEKYTKRLNELLEEHGTKESLEEKRKVAEKITSLVKMYDWLQTSYSQAKERLIDDVERYVDQYDRYFEAELQGNSDDQD